MIPVACQNSNLRQLGRKEQAAIWELSDHLAERRLLGLNLAF
jgi:hypothetical protein